MANIIQQWSVSQRRGLSRMIRNLPEFAFEYFSHFLVANFFLVVPAILQDMRKCDSSTLGQTHTTPLSTSPSTVSWMQPLRAAKSPTAATTSCPIASLGTSRSRTQCPNGQAHTTRASATDRIPSGCASITLAAITITERLLLSPSIGVSLTAPLHLKHRSCLAPLCLRIRSRRRKLPVPLRL